MKLLLVEQGANYQIGYALDGNGFLFGLITIVRWMWQVNIQANAVCICCCACYAQLMGVS